MTVYTIETGRIYDFAQRIRARKFSDFIVFYDESRKMQGKIELTEREQELLDIVPSHANSLILNKYDMGQFKYFGTMVQAKTKVEGEVL